MSGKPRGEPKMDPRLTPYFEPASKLWLRNFNRILEMWKAEGYSYGELRRRSGIGETTLSYYRSGERTPSLEAVTRIARAMGVPIEMFFRRQQYNKTDSRTDKTESKKECTDNGESNRVRSERGVRRGRPRKVLEMQAGDGAASDQDGQA